MSWLSSAGLCTGSLGALVAFFFACSPATTSYVDEPEQPVIKDGGTDARRAPDSGLGVLTFRPEESFSGFDGQHTFKVPVAVYDSTDDLEVAATDPSAAEIVPKKLTTPDRGDGTLDTGKYFLVTVKRSGTITLRATSSGRTAESQINVASYPAGRWQTGETRYKNGSTTDPACTQCHSQGQAIDHSPAALATATDEKIGVVITTGVSTGGFPIKIDGKPSHRWTVTDDERDGLVTYLRSLEPRGFE